MGLTFAELEARDAEHIVGQDKPGSKLVKFWTSAQDPLVDDPTTTVYADVFWEKVPPRQTDARGTVARRIVTVQPKNSVAACGMNSVDDQGAFEVDSMKYRIMAVSPGSGVWRVEGHWTKRISRNAKQFIAGEE